MAVVVVAAVAVTSSPSAIAVMSSSSLFQNGRRVRHVVEGTSSTCLLLLVSAKRSALERCLQIIPRLLWLAQVISLSRVRQLLPGSH